jgi:hypothetical protein
MIIPHGSQQSIVFISYVRHALSHPQTFKKKESLTDPSLRKYRKTSAEKQAITSGLLISGKLYRLHIIINAGNLMVVRNRCERCVFVAPVA